MTNALTTATPIVHIKDGQVFANSRDVAEYFGKQHMHVLRDIDALIESAPEASSNFGLCPYQAVAGGRMYRSYDMTRDGFTLLAMGFTGKRALEFKLKYIAAFNEMEAKLKASTPALPDFSDPVAAARAWADAYEQKRIAEQRVQELTPLAVVGSRAVAHEHSLGRFVRTLPGVNTMKIKSDLKAFNYLYKRNGAYRVYSRFQYLFVERVVDEYGTIEIFPTAEGRALIISLYEQGRLTMKKGRLPRVA